MTALKLQEASFNDIDALEHELNEIQDVIPYDEIQSFTESQSESGNSKNKVSLSLGGVLVSVFLTGSISPFPQVDFDKRYRVPDYSVEELVEGDYQLQESLSLILPFEGDQMPAYVTIDEDFINEEKEVVKVYQANMKVFIGTKGKRIPV